MPAEQRQALTGWRVRGHAGAFHDIWGHISLVADGWTADD